MNRDELMAAMKAAPFEMGSVTVNGWGSLHVRETTAGTVDQLNAAAKDGSDPVSSLARACAAVICNEKGELLFDPANEDDVKFLAGMGYRKLTIVAGAAAKLGQDTGKDSSGN